jgi:tetratricopeptide (TPR) repeat protein
LKHKQRLLAMRVFLRPVLVIGCLLLPAWWCWQIGDSEMMDQADAVTVTPAAEAELPQAWRDWQHLWQALAMEGLAALAPDDLDTSLRAAGDTRFMRYRRQLSTYSDRVRWSFQMAALSPDPQQRLQLLTPLTHEQSPVIRFRAQLELARIHLRLQAWQQAQDHAKAALAITDLPTGLTADAWFILGYIAWVQGDVASAALSLATAVRDDPGFWDARQLYVQVLMTLLRDSSSTTGQCLQHTRLLIENLGALPALAQDRRQFLDFIDQLSQRQPSHPHPAWALSLGLGYDWSGQQQQARAALTQAQQLAATCPNACCQAIARQAGHWLARATAANE